MSMTMRRLRPVATVLLATSAILVGLQGCKSEKKPGAATGSDPWASPDPGPKAPAQVITKPFLWKAERDGVTSWLFGTIHLGVNADTQLPEVVFEKLKEARSFAMEADTTEDGLALAMHRSDGGSLRNDLGPAYWKKLEDAIGARMAQHFEGMKPFAVMTVLATKDVPMTLPMDRVLLEDAQEAGKPIHYFEKAVDQLAMIEPWMSADDIKALLDNRETAKTRTLKLLEAYKTGEEAQMGAFFDDKTMWLAAGRKPELFPAYLDSILGRRNRAWVPQIEKLHADGGAFIAVGAGHLVGPGNLNGLLTERGFVITRVTR